MPVSHNGTRGRDRHGGRGSPNARPYTPRTPQDTDGHPASLIGAGVEHAPSGALNSTKLSRPEIKDFRPLHRGAQI